MLKNNEKIPIVYLGTTLNKKSNQLDKLYLTLLINNKLVKNRMIDFCTVVNIMFADVIKKIVLKVDTPFGKCYAMDNRFVPIVEISASYGMLLSRNG